MTYDSSQRWLTPDGKWYWNGNAWQPSPQLPPSPPLPLPGPPSWPGASPAQWGPTPPAALDNSFAWALAFAPLLLVFMSGLLASIAGTSASALAVLAAVGLNVTLSVQDARRVRAAGYFVSTTLAVFLIPVYLFRRQGRLRQNYAIPIVWCVCFFVSLGGAGIIENTVGVQLNTGVVEHEIQAGVQRQHGMSVTVDCPSSVSIRTGESFQCVVMAADGSTTLADVTVQNGQGDVVWRVR